MQAVLQTRAWKTTHTSSQSVPSVIVTSKVIVLLSVCVGNSVQCVEVLWEVWLALCAMHQDKLLSQTESPRSTPAIAGSVIRTYYCTFQRRWNRNRSVSDQKSPYHGTRNRMWAKQKLSSFGVTLLLTFLSH